MSHDQAITPRLDTTDLEKEPFSRPPAVGIMQIDDQSATIVRFERTVTEEHTRYSMSFLLGNKSVARLQGLDATELPDVVGLKNARAILSNETGKGVLQGESLRSAYGLSPAESARRDAHKNDRSALAASPEAADDSAEKRQADTTATAKEPDGPGQDALNAVTQEKRSKEQGKGRHLDGGDNEVQSDEVFSPAEEDRLPIVPQEVAAKYLKVGDRYHFQRNPEAVAFRDRGNKLETQTNSAAVADSMVRIAQARGWDEIRVTGSETFKREVWMEAAARGMHVRGYSPTDADKARLLAVQNRTDFRGRESTRSVDEKKTREQAMAEAFRTERPEAAMQKYPELAGAYAGVEEARRKVEQERLSNEQAKIVMDRLHTNALNAIERGRVPKVNITEKGPDRRKEKETTTRHHPEIEIGR